MNSPAASRARVICPGRGRPRNGATSTTSPSRSAGSMLWPRTGIESPTPSPSRASRPGAAWRALGRSRPLREDGVDSHADAVHRLRLVPVAPALLPQARQRLRVPVGIDELVDTRQARASGARALGAPLPPGDRQAPFALELLHV